MKLNERALTTKSTDCTYEFYKSYSNNINYEEANSQITDSSLSPALKGAESETDSKN